MHVLRLSGDEACEIDAEADERLSDIRKRLLRSLRADDTNFDVIFPDGRLLSGILLQKPSVVLSSVFESVV